MFNPSRGGEMDTLRVVLSPTVMVTGSADMVMLMITCRVKFTVVVSPASTVVDFESLSYPVAEVVTV